MFISNGLWFAIFYSFIIVIIITMQAFLRFVFVYVFQTEFRDDF